MKEIILSHLKSVQSVMDDNIVPLKDRHDRYGHFNFYWDVLAFIIWMEKNEPEDYELYDLETCFEILDKFGDFFVKIIEPARIEFIYRHDDGILNIDVPLQDMIRKSYDFLIDFQENELAGMKTQPDTATFSLNDVMDVLLGLKAEVSTALYSKPIHDSAGLAKEIVKELSPSKPVQKLNKKQQLEADIVKGVAQQKLKMMQKAAKQRK